MIETPAAAVACDTFVNDVAFFSIGTNDLVQYTLAVDRGNANLASRFTPLHPAVLKLIRRTVTTARSHDLDVAVCGEMASQPLMAFALDRPRRAAAERWPAIGAARQAHRARASRSRSPKRQPRPRVAPSTAAEAEAELRRRLDGSARRRCAGSGG